MASNRASRRRRSAPLLPAGALSAAALAATAILLAPATVSAQAPDFLFGRPRVTLGVWGGWAMPRADSDIYDFTRDELTLGDRDFDALSLAGELAFRVNERFDVGVELGWARSEKLAEYRDWVGEDDLPIQQTTRLARRPITFNARAYLLDRGRTVSRFAWVPSAWSPWVGVGGGWMWYKFEREGEFIDFGTLDIFRDKVASEGTVPTFHVMGGADVSVGPRFVVTGQIRYSWASAELDPYYFEGFDDIDLAGFQASAGFKVRL